MNEVIKVSIAGINIALNQDTYELLNNYLQKLESKYIGNPDGAEIIADIESRIIELILEKQEQSAIVSASIVEDIIERLGYPESDDTNSAPKETIPPQYDQQNRGNIINNRLYRPKFGNKIAGVCAGLSKHLNINVAWVRLAFLLSIIFTPYSLIYACALPLQLSLGGIVLYIILWIAIPKATWKQVEQEMNEGHIDTSTEKQDVFNASKSGEIPHEKLYRPNKGGVIGGVCSALSTHFQVDVTWIRLTYILLIALPFTSFFIADTPKFIFSFTFGIILSYIVLWISIPSLRYPKPTSNNKKESQSPHHINNSEPTNNNPTNSSDVFPKRLYRSSKGGIIAGVCSGLSKYTNINVILIRLLYIILLSILGFISFMMITHHKSTGGITTSLLLLSSVILSYIVMWIAVPMAKSARQKLEMSGECVTAFSIGRQISRDATEIDSQSKEAGLASIFAEMLKFIGKVISKILKLILVAISFSVGIPLLLAIVIILTLFIMSINGLLAFSFPYFMSIIPIFIAQYPYLFPNEVLETTLLSIPAMIIPLTATLVALIALICSWKRGIAWCLTIMIAIWIAIGSCFTYTIANQMNDMNIAKEFASHYSEESTHSNNSKLYKYTKILEFKVYKEYYIEYSTIKDTLKYERGTIFGGDTTVDAKLVTKYVKVDDGHRFDTLDIKNMGIHTTPPTTPISSEYTICKILFALSILATLWVLWMSIKDRKKYYALGLTIMIALWLLTCAYFIKELYFTSKVRTTKSIFETTETMVGDSVKIDTIANYKHIVDIN